MNLPSHQLYLCIPLIFIFTFVIWKTNKKCQIPVYLWSIRSVVLQLATSSSPCIGTLLWSEFWNEKNTCDVYLMRLTLKPSAENSTMHFFPKYIYIITHHALVVVVIKHKHLCHCILFCGPLIITNVWCVFEINQELLDGIIHNYILMFYV